MDTDPQPGQSQIPVTFLDVLRRLEWRIESLAIAIILAEASLVWIAFGLIMSETGTRSAYPFWIVAFVLLGSHYVIHLLDQARIWSPDYEIIVTASIAVTLLVSVKFGSFPGVAIWDAGWLIDAVNGLAFFPTEQARPIWGNVILVIYAWFRARSREEPSVDSAYTMFRWGTIALGLILVVILVGAPDGLEIRERLSVGTIGFFGGALTAIGLARMRLEGFRAAAPLGPRWLATFATPILAIIVVAIIAAGIFSRSFLETMIWLLSPVFFVLGVVFQIIVLAIAIIAFLILTPIFWLIGDLDPEIQNATATPAAQTGESALDQAQPEQFVIPEALQYLIAAIVLVAIVSLLTRYLFRRRSRFRASTIEERESVMDWSDLMGSLGGRLRSLFDREGSEDPYANLRGDDRWKHTIRIRERYRDLQRRGADLGRARFSRETAEEYRPAVGGRFAADGRPAVNGMTHIYRRIRYSGIPASDDDATEMDGFWDSARNAEPGDSD